MPSTLFETEEASTIRCVSRGIVAFDLGGGDLPLDIESNIEYRIGSWTSAYIDKDIPVL